MISIYKNSTEIEVTTRRAEIFEKYNKVIQYGRETQCGL